MLFSFFYALLLFLGRALLLVPLDPLGSALAKYAYALIEAQGLLELVVPVVDRHLVSHLASV